ncbi:MAG: hypothetical protein AAF487_08075 [Bacteroidota bacterium]
MKAASAAEIKKELKEKNPNELLELCLRLARFKKENKELMTYLLFEAEDEHSYVMALKEDVADQMKEVNRTQFYYCKKNLRRILRQMDRFIRYSGKKETEIEMRVYFCNEMLREKIPFKRTKALRNLFEGQIKKAKNALKSLHPDLKYDFSVEIKELEEQALA